jgi:hypothetical protein
MAWTTHTGRTGGSDSDDSEGDVAELRSRLAALSRPGTSVAGLLTNGG